jgi:hypothetical protein
MLVSLFILAQERGTHEPPDEGIGLGLILLGFLFAILVFATIFFLFRRYSNRTRETGPDRSPHRPGHVGRLD